MVRPQIEAALNAGEISETATHWQITEHGKLFLNTLLERFYKTKPGRFHVRMRLLTKQDKTWFSCFVLSAENQ